MGSMGSGWSLALWGLIWQEPWAAVVSLVLGPSGSLCSWMPMWSLGLQELIENLEPQEPPMRSGQCWDIWGPGFKGTYWEPLRVSGVSLAVVWASVGGVCSEIRHALHSSIETVWGQSWASQAWGWVLGIM